MTTNTVLDKLGIPAMLDGLADPGDFTSHHALSDALMDMGVREDTVNCFRSACEWATQAMHHCQWTPWNWIDAYFATLGDAIANNAWPGFPQKPHVRPEIRQDLGNTTGQAITWFQARESLEIRAAAILNRHAARVIASAEEVVVLGRLLRERPAQTIDAYRINILGAAFEISGGLARRITWKCTNRAKIASIQKFYAAMTGSPIMILNDQSVAETVRRTLHELDLNRFMDFFGLKGLSTACHVIDIMFPG